MDRLERGGKLSIDAKLKLGGVLVTLDEEPKAGNLIEDMGNNLKCMKIIGNREELFENRKKRT